MVPLSVEDILVGMSGFEPCDDQSYNFNRIYWLLFESIVDTNKTPNFL